MVWLLMILILGKPPMPVMIMTSQSDCVDLGKRITGIMNDGNPDWKYPATFQCQNLPQAK